MRWRRRKEVAVTRPTTGLEPKEPVSEKSAERSVSIAAPSRDTHSAGGRGEKSWIRFACTVLVESPNAAVQRPPAALSSATHVHNEMAHVRRARADVSRSAATAC